MAAVDEVKVWLMRPGEGLYFLVNRVAHTWANFPMVMMSTYFSHLKYWKANRDGVRPKVWISSPIIAMLWALHISKISLKKFDDPG